MKEIKNIWVTKRKDEIVLEVSIVEEGNLKFILSLNQAESLMFDLETLIKRIRKGMVKQKN